MALGAKDIRSLLVSEATISSWSVRGTFGLGRWWWTDCLAATTVFPCAHSSLPYSLVHISCTSNTIHDASISCSTHRSLSVSSMLSCLIMPHTKEACICKPLPGGLVNMHNSDISGRVEMRARSQTHLEETHLPYGFCNGLRALPGSFLPFRVGNPVPSLPFPTKTRPCPLTMIFYAPRWSFSILPVIALSTLATPFTRPCKPHLKSTT